MNPGLGRLVRTLAAAGTMFVSMATVSVAHAWGTEGRQVVALVPSRCQSFSVDLREVYGNRGFDC
jgi:hypothetical protein